MPPLGPDAPTNPRTETKEIPVMSTLAQRNTVRKAIKQYYLERRRQGASEHVAAGLAMLYAEERLRLNTEDAQDYVIRAREDIEDGN